MDDNDPHFRVADPCHCIRCGGRILRPQHGPLHLKGVAGANGVKECGERFDMAIMCSTYYVIFGNASGCGARGNCSSIKILPKSVCRIDGKKYMRYVRM